MKTLLLTTLTVLALSTFAHAAQANHVGIEERPWSEQVASAVRTGGATLTDIDLGKNTLPTAVLTQLEAIADDQAQVWGDTILEGDFVAEQAVKLESVQVVQMNSAFLGYRVTYSSVAFETSDCDPDTDLKSCTQGRIVESSYVAPSLKAWVRDESAMADFVADVGVVSGAE